MLAAFVLNRQRGDSIAIRDHGDQGALLLGKTPDKSLLTYTQNRD